MGIISVDFKLRTTSSLPKESVVEDIRAYALFWPTTITSDDVSLYFLIIHYDAMLMIRSVLTNNYH